VAFVETTLPAIFRLYDLQLVTLPAAEPCAHVQQGSLALKEGHPQSLALLRNLVVLKALQWRLVRLQTAVTLEQAALQVDPESVARPVPCDLRMHSLNAHCIFKLS